MQPSVPVAPAQPAESASTTEVTSQAASAVSQPSAQSAPVSAPTPPSSGNNVIVVTGESTRRQDPAQAINQVSYEAVQAIEATEQALSSLDTFVRVVEGETGWQPLAIRNGAERR